jgi:WD40 repeat protein
MSWMVGGPGILTETGSSDWVILHGSFAPNGRLAAYSTLKELVVLDVQARRVVARRKPASGIFLEPTFRPGSKQVMTLTADKGLLLWDFAARADPIELKNHVHAAYSPDGSVLAAFAMAGENGTVELLDPATGKPRRVLARTTKTWVRWLAFAPGGRALAAGIFDAEGIRIRYWDVQTGAVLMEMPDSSGCDHSAQFSADGSMLAACGLKKVAVWSVPSKVRAVLPGKPAGK